MLMTFQAYESSTLTTTNVPSCSKQDEVVEIEVKIEKENSCNH